MTAIGGAWRMDGASGAREDCARVLQAQAIYGPHARDQRSLDEIAFGRRLYRLLPEDHFDAQPLVGPSGAMLVADARLDNRADLHGALNIESNRAVETSDAAVLLAAWERWGEACFDHIVGVYAFAVWEPIRGRLILARDPLGQRPLHYHRTVERLVFASMPVGVQALAAAPPAPDARRLRALLALAPETGSRSAFRDIERVEPGTVLTIGRASITVKTHWSPRRKSTPLGSADNYAHALRVALDDAVAAQLRGADNTVGAHLSSGWDSAGVTATAARMMQSRGGRVIAFTAVPSGDGLARAPEGRHGDEGGLAARQASLNPAIEHVRVADDHRSPLDDLDVIGALAGRPAINPCNQVWFDDINRAARTRGVAVLLTGDYGNISLTYGGEDGLSDLAASARWGAWFERARAFVASGALGWRGVFAATFGTRLPKPLWAALRRLNGAWVGRPGAHSALRRALWREPSDAGSAASFDSFDRRMAALRRFDPGCALKATLARWGVDVRNPLADQRLVELCLSVPCEVLLGEGRSRSLARRALADRVAPEILGSPTRGYQAVDWHVGLTAARAQLTEEIKRLEACHPAAALLDLPRLRRLLIDWPTTGWEREAVVTDYRLALLRGVAVGRFARRMLGGNP